MKFLFYFRIRMKGRRQYYNNTQNMCDFDPQFAVRVKTPLPFFRSYYCHR